jgi:hypothetical protein
MNAQEYVGYCNGLNDAKAIMKGVTIDEWNRSNWKN